MTPPYLRFDRVLLGESLFAFAHVDQGPTVNLLVRVKKLLGETCSLKKRLLS